MKARAVIGANFGDEGKGLVTDYLCSKGAGVVVRFNGGAQAGHTVVAPTGQRHVFGHFGSGTFVGVPTFLSQFFICNPIMFFKELAELHALKLEPTVFAHPDCLVTTFADMIINQRLEEARGKDRHGSVGLGVGETVERSMLPALSITMGDLWNGSAGLKGRMAEICDKYAIFRTGKKIEEPAMFAKFLEGCDMMAERVHPAGMGQCKDPVFEGSQGLLLDQNNKEFFPHVTRSNTGIKNVRLLCAQGGFDEIEPYYVSRTYLTRHGSGPLPGHDPKLKYFDDTNVPHQWQGAIRFAPLDVQALETRCYADFGSHDYKLVLTHCDQMAAPMGSTGDLFSHGPTHDDVSTSKTGESP